MGKRKVVSNQVAPNPKKTRKNASNPAEPAVPAPATPESVAPETIVPEASAVPEPAAPRPTASEPAASQLASAEPTVSITRSTEPATAEPPVTPSSTCAVRDARYYFADGSVVLLVNRVLFKVHASLLAAESTMLRDLFAEGDTGLKASTDDAPFTLPGVRAPEFRRFLQVFYWRPSDKTAPNLFEQLKPFSNNDRYTPYLPVYVDAALLAKKFGMVDIESWAKTQLSCLLNTSARRHSAATRASLNPNGIPYYYKNALLYAQSIDDKPLERNARNLLQCYCTVPNSLPPPILFSILDCPNLRQTDPVLFGSTFLALLNLGRETWDKPPFTQNHRLMLCSALIELSPLPASLSDNMKMPIIAKPSNGAGGLLVFSNTCQGTCISRLSATWMATFTPTYYQDVASREVLKATTALETLPKLRLHFTTAIRLSPDCARGCCAAVIGWLDNDLDQLFSRLAGFYKEIIWGGGS